MSPRARRALRGIELALALVWGLISGIAQGLFAVLVLAFYRVCLGVAIAVGAIVFAVFRIDSTESRDRSQRED